MKRLIAVLAAVLVSTGTANAATVGTLDGAWVSQGTTQSEVQSTLCQPPNTCETIPYPNTPGQEQAGAAATQQWVATHPGEVTLVGHSEGAEVLDLVLRQWAADPSTAPDPSRITVIRLGDPENKYGGYVVVTGGDSGCGCGVGVPEDTPYKVIVVTNQYDGWADWPNNPASQYYWLAVANAFVGMWTVHLNYYNVNPYADYPSYTEGNITYKLAPTTSLPILLGGSNPQLQSQIEDAYVRPPYTTGGTSSTTTTVVPVAAPVVAPTQAAPQTTSASTVTGSSTASTSTLSAKPSKTTAHKPVTASSSTSTKAEPSQQSVSPKKSSATSKHDATTHVSSRQDSTHKKLK
jgi:hypothetical protein